MVLALSVDLSPDLWTDILGEPWTSFITVYPCGDPDTARWMPDWSWRIHPAQAEGESTRSKNWRMQMLLFCPPLGKRRRLQLRTMTGTLCCCTQIPSGHSHLGHTGSATAMPEGSALLCWFCLKLEVTGRQHTG